MFGHRLPQVPETWNGKRVALIGAGPASLAVANDLLPLGYRIEIFEKSDKPGGLMRSNIPSFRLPAVVLDEEIEMILGRGVQIHYNSPVTSMRKRCSPRNSTPSSSDRRAPRGKDLEIPGRQRLRSYPHRHRLAESRLPSGIPIPSAKTF